MPQLTKEVLKRLRNDESTQFAIANGMNRKFRTVERWIRTNDEMLASKAVVSIIKEKMDLSEDDAIVKGFKATA